MADNNYTLSIPTSEDYVLIDINSPMTVELGLRCGREAAELGKQRRINRFLFDLRGAPNVEPVLPNYNFAYKDLQRFGFSHMARSALLTDAEDKSHDFLETLFINAGYEVRLFRDEAQAVAWLLP